MASLPPVLNVCHLLDVQLDGAALVFVQSLKGSCTNTDRKHLAQAKVAKAVGAAANRSRLRHSRHMASSRTRQPMKLSKSMSSRSSQ